MTDILLALAVLVGVPTVLVLVGLLVFEQIKLMHQEWAQAQQLKQKIAAKQARTKRLELLEQELLELEEIENRR